MATDEKSLVLAEGEGDDLIALEQQLAKMLGSVPATVPKRVTMVIDLDMEAARQLYEALKVARLSGQAIQ